MAALLTRRPRHLAPGGWIEVSEIKLPYDCDDGSMGPDSYLNQWCKYAVEAGVESGRPFDVYEKMWGWLGQVGFERMENKVHKYVTVIVLRMLVLMVQ